MIEIAIINASTVIKDAEFKRVVPALQTQITRDFEPIWGIEAKLRAISKGQKPAVGEWWLTILDDADQAGVLGYHDVTPKGLPLGKVFAKTTQAYGEKWSVTASHELLEMLADPNINLTVLEESAFGNSGRLYAYEVCDPCESDACSYRIGDVWVSDFVFPSWFESFQPKTAQFDFKKKIKKPFGLAKGGYIGVYDLVDGSGWEQLTADLVPAARAIRPPVGSRRERRTISLPRRLRSTIK